MICPVCRSPNSNDARCCSNCHTPLSDDTLARPEDNTRLASRPLATAGSHGTATVTAPIPLDRLRPGQMLGSRYLIEAEAGHGGMGRVYRATDLALNRTVALKVIRAELALDSVIVARLNQEIRLASQISHPHVLRIHDLGELDGIRFISMAWVDGEDLRHLIARRGRLDASEISRIAGHVCEGLQAAHEQGILHRDLKPENILINSRGDACISDFGLAQSTQEGSPHFTQTGHAVGTPRYMAPEQLAAKPADGRTDIYSLGLVLYEMAAGDTPELRDRLSHAPSPKVPNPGISDKLANIITRCLEPDPEQRYATAGELLLDLRADRVAAIPQRADWKRRWMYGAIVVALVAAAVVYALRPHPRDIPPLASAKYIAVLPYPVSGSDATLESYSQGITEGVASRLFTLRDIHPISQAAVETIDLNKPLDEIARQLGANVIVDGRLESRDDHIIVHSRVSGIGAHQKTISESTFTGSPNTLLDIENRIYEQIAAAVGVRTTETPTAANLSAYPTQNPEAYDLYLRGRELLKEKRDVAGAEQALESFQQASAKDPSFALAWAGVADASLQIYRTKRDSFWAAKALDAGRRAARGGNDVPEVHFTLGSVYTATGKNAEAVEELKRALALEPNSDNGYLRLGRAYLATGQTESALGALRKAVDLNPYYWYNHDQLGLAFFRIGRNREALAEFKTAAELDPANGIEYNRIGSTYWRMGRLQDSIEQFKKVIKLQPSADAYTNLGVAYFALARYRDAIVDFKEAARMNDKNLLYRVNLGDAYRQAGQPEEAARAYAEAIRLAYQQLQVNPQDSATMGYLALCYAREGDLDKAAEFVRRARAIDSADNQLMYDEAVVNALSGRSQPALAALQMALEKGYSAEEARNDSDLKSLKNLPEFQKILENFERQPETRR